MAINDLMLHRWQGLSLFLKQQFIWRPVYIYALVKKRRSRVTRVVEKLNYKEKPLLYSCSGCSSAAQMANYLAVQLDREGIAEMSCIAGVGGNVKKLVHTAASGRKIIVIDGCPLACSRACLANHAITADLEVELTGLGVKKINHVDFDKTQAHRILTQISRQALQLHTQN